MCVRQFLGQTPSTGLQHPSFNHCRIYSYAIGSTKLSANEQFFVSAQTVVSLLQTTQNKACHLEPQQSLHVTSTNKTTIVWIETELSFLPGVDASHFYVRALVLGCSYSHISTQNFRKALTASVDSCPEIKKCPFSGVTKSGSLEERAGKRCSECVLGVADNKL